MKWYLAKVQELWVSFDKMVLTRLPLENNTRVDSLARLGSVTDEEIEASDQQVLILTEPSITPTIKVLQIEEGIEALEWAKEIIQYLKEGKSRHVRMRSTRYTLIGDTLFRRGYTLPLLKCISKFKAEYVL